MAHLHSCDIIYRESRTDAGLSESFQVKVGLHQGSVLSPLLFAVVTDVVPVSRKWYAFRVAVC